MRRRTSDQTYPAAVPEPTGEEWLSVDDLRLWLPGNLRTKFERASIPSDLRIETGGPEWAVARSVLRFLLRCIHGEAFKYQFDWVKKVGEGLSKRIFRADITIFEGGEETYESFAISQLSRDADSETCTRIIKEQFVLDSIGRHETTFLLPEPLGIIWHDGVLVAAMSYAYGMPLELRAGRSQVERPWEIVGQIAADIHKLPTGDLPADLRRYPTRQVYVIAKLNGYRRYEIAEIQYTVQWILQNLPPKNEAVLIHGDLLGQNILRTLEGQLFVIDWEYAFLGDPAYDLAIVTRGVRRPFQTEQGLQRLIDAYLSAGGQEITRKDVYVHELLLCLGWYEQSLDRSRGGHGPEYYLDFLRRLLKRAGE